MTTSNRRWRQLSTSIRGLWEQARAVEREFSVHLADMPARLMVAREKALGGLLASKVYGPEMVEELPHLGNCGTLAWLARRRLVVHDLTPEACNVVDTTDLHSLPHELPERLRGPWIVETPHPERGDILCSSPFPGVACVGIGVYPLDGALMLLGRLWPDGMCVARWSPNWNGADLDDSVTPETLTMFLNHASVDAHVIWTRDAARLVLVLALLLDAKDSPVRIETEPGERGPAGEHRGRDREERRAWAYARVSLGEHARPYGPLLPQQGPADHAPARADMEAMTAGVRGHLKRQPFGPGRAQRRWQWIEGYSARRWVAPATKTRVIP